MYIKSIIVMKKKVNLLFTKVNIIVTIYYETITERLRSIEKDF